ncbi:hypothetical protein Ahia01_001277000, partial [Argonauta hians]
MEIVRVDHIQQLIVLRKAMINCRQLIANQSAILKGSYCNRTWDDIMCWPDTAAGTTARQRCPNYINHFNTDAYAIRECLPKGEWYSRPNTNKTWTNYTACSMNVTFPKVSKVLQEHLPRIVMMSNIGFGISLGSLFIACLIMIGFRKLRCRRNTIHVNLFLSFILRALMNLTKVNMVKPWDCHLFFTVFMYSVLTNFVWVFIEGIYLHILIYFSVFAENPKTKWYIISGWVFPLFFVTPWVIMRIQEDNKHCWNIYRDRNIFWIIRAPILISVA